MSIRTVRDTLWTPSADRDLDYHGADAEYLKVQAMQLLLRCQVLAIRQLWSLPETFEVNHAHRLCCG